MAISTEISFQIPDDTGRSLAGFRPGTIESRESWIAAWVTLAILSVAYGSTLLIVVGLRAMELDLGVSRSVLALAGALTWIGTGLGGIVMGWIADRIGVRNSVLIGCVMVALGLVLSSTGQIWALYIGQGVLIGFLGMGAIYPPLVIYVSRRFDRRRGTAIALISSGQYVAGVIWPAAFERLIAGPGWRVTYLAYAGIILLGTLPLAALFLRNSSVGIGPGANRAAVRSRVPVLGAAQYRAGDPLRGRYLLLRSDGDTSGASRGVLRRYRHRRGDGSADAVCAARLRVLLATVLGRLRRPLWRIEDSAGGLGLSGRIDRRFPADPERGWIICGSGRLRLWFFRDHPRLCGGDPRPVPVGGGVVAASRWYCSPR